jgi:hypothetical protein
VGQQAVALRSAGASNILGLNNQFFEIELLNETCSNYNMLCVFLLMIIVPLQSMQDGRTMTAKGIDCLYINYSVHTCVCLFGEVLAGSSCSAGQWWFPGRQEQAAIILC